MTRRLPRCCNVIANQSVTRLTPLRHICGYAPRARILYAAAPAAAVAARYTDNTVYTISDTLHIILTGGSIPVVVALVG